MSQDPDNLLVRVRGGHKGFRMIALSDYKAEIKERKNRRTKRTDKLKEKRKVK